MNMNKTFQDIQESLIEAIPRSWRKSRLGFEAKVIDPQPDHRAPEMDDNGYPYIGIRDIDDYGFVNIDSCRLVKLHAIEKQENSFSIDKDDLIFCKVGTLGFSRFFQKPNTRFALSATLVIIKINKNNDPKFINYSLQSNYIRNTIEFESTGSTRKALGINTIRDFEIILPTLNEQKIISKYLDQKTLIIDQLIKKIEQKIELLKEQKLALITNYVTKGLYKNTKFKDSEIKWIGKIPSNWEIKKFKYLIKFGMGETILQENLTSDGIPVLSATESYKILGYYKNPKLILNKGDLIIPARGNSIGHTKIVKEKSVSTQTTIYGKKIKEASMEYIKYFCDGYKEQLFLFDKTAIPQITIDQVANNFLIFPPINEQIEIVRKLDNINFKFEKLTSHLIKKITKLKEYRQSLISSIVIGKVRLTDNVI